MTKKPRYDSTCMPHTCNVSPCRVVICDLSGRYIDQIGGNGPALRDGSFDSAAFNRPQGLAYSARRARLYVADTENHSLREVRVQCVCSLYVLVVV